MFAGIMEFTWHVHSGGYECTDVTLDGKTYRSVVPSIGNFGYLKECFPLEAPGLHRKFAALELTEKAVLAFTNEWGPLKNEHAFWDPGPDQEEIEDFSWVRDPIDLCFTQIQRMKALVGLWDVLQDGQGRDLSEVIDVSQEKVSGTSWEVTIRFKEAPEMRWDHSFHARNWPAFFGRMGQGAERTVARMCLLELINESLWGSCSPGMRWEQRDELSLCFSPHHLEAALWLLLVQEILGNKTLKQCIFCKGYFEAAQEEDSRRWRSDKKYCSPKCRAAAFRERRDKAASGDGKVHPGQQSARAEKPATTPRKPRRKAHETCQHE